MGRSIGNRSLVAAGPHNPTTFALANGSLPAALWDKAAPGKRGLELHEKVIITAISGYGSTAAAHVVDIAGLEHGPYRFAFPNHGGTIELSPTLLAVNGTIPTLQSIVGDTEVHIEWHVLGADAGQT